MVGRIMVPPKGVYILSPRACECYIAKKAFADGAERRVLTQGEYAGSSKRAQRPHSEGLYKRGREAGKSEREKQEESRVRGEPCRCLQRLEKARKGVLP